MKAILYAGLPRLIIENIDSIKKNYAQENTKLFFTLWEDSEQIDETCEVLKENFNNIFIKKIIPRSYLWESKLDPSRFKGTSYHFGLLQYDALQQCFEFACEILKEKKYEYLWIRSRGDILVNNKFEQNIEGCDLLVPGIHYKIGYCDYFSIGNYKGMNSYCSQINTILDLVDLDIYLPVEITLALHLNRNKTLVRINRNLPKILLSKEKNGLKKRNFYLKENLQSLGLHPGQFLSTDLKKESSFSLFPRFFYSLILDLKNNFKFK